MNKIEAVQAQENQSNSSRKWLSRVLDIIAPYCVILGLTFFATDNGVVVNGGSKVSQAGPGYRIDNGGYANLSNGAVIKDDPFMEEAEVMNPEGDYDGNSSSEPKYFPRTHARVSYHGK